MSYATYRNPRHRKPSLLLPILFGAGCLVALGGLAAFLLVQPPQPISTVAGVQPAAKGVQVFEGFGFDGEKQKLVGPFTVPDRWEWSYKGPRIYSVVVVDASQVKLPRDQQKSAGIWATYDSPGDLGAWVDKGGTYYIRLTPLGITGPWKVTVKPYGG